MTPSLTSPAQNKTYEGKAKILSAGTQANTLIVQFKDEATAFNGGKFAIMPGKGVLNATISKLLFSYLNQHHIHTCYQGEGPDDNELIYESLKMIPLEVVVRNVSYGSVSSRYQLTDGTPFKQPVIEYFWKKDEANDPLITRDMIRELNLLPAQTTLCQIEQAALAINTLLIQRFNPTGIVCADFKLEFGINTSGQLVLGDELSPDNFRLRDKQTGQILDKDVFRLEKGDLIETYTDVLNRLKNNPVEAANSTTVYTSTVQVTSRKNILNPESKAITQAVQRNGYTQVSTVNASKQYTLHLEANSLSEAQTITHELGSKVLSNPVIEDMTITNVTLTSTTESPNNVHS